MAHQPSAIDSELPPYAVALAQRARSGRLVIYAGAGLSFAEPAGLPSGAEVAKRLHARLKGAFPPLAGVDHDDLVAIADAVAGLPGGEEALRLTAVEVAEFTTAAPTCGHVTLALMLLEGVIDVLTTNWDNCIERGGLPAHVPSVVTAQDLLDVVGRRVLKIHGCATRPQSLLLTTAHLSSPPAWVADETRAKLGNAVVVFVGIGDIAGYVKQRLTEAIANVGTVDNIRVVSPGIVTGWDASPWSELVPALDVDHRIPATADGFIEKLGAAYVHLTLGDLAAHVADEAAVAEAFTVGAAALRKHDALTVLAWTRRSGVVSTAGTSVLNSEPMIEAIAALSKAAGPDFVITRDWIIESAAKNMNFEVLTSVGGASAARLRREARNRLEQHLARGVKAPTFLIGGGIGWTTATDALPADIMGDGDAGDVVDGPANVEPTILHAREVLAA